MFKGLRIKEIILIALYLVFIPSYAFYQRVIAPRFGTGKIRVLKSKIEKGTKKLGVETKKSEDLVSEIGFMEQQTSKNSEKVARMIKESEEFKKEILHLDYEVELYQFIFGRDARYSIIGLGNNPRRNDRNPYVEVTYDYLCKGKYEDIIKLVKKIENVSRSLSISKLEVRKPKAQESNQAAKDSGEVEASMQINVILSSDKTAKNFEDFKRNEPELNIRKIDGDPWNENFGEVRSRAEGPTGPVKKLFIESILFLKEPSRRSVKFLADSSWYRIGDEFKIEARKEATTVRLLAIGGNYVILKHLNKNLVFKIKLNVAEEDSTREQTNEKSLLLDLEL